MLHNAGQKYILTLQIRRKEGGTARPDLSPHCTDDEWMDGWIGGPHGQSRSNGGLDFGVQQQAIDDGIQSFPHPYSPLSLTFSPLVMALLADLFSHGRGKQVCTTLQ